MYDALIIGAGPGGAAAAVSLAQRGVKNVLLLDRDGFPRDKTCGSGLSPNAIAICDELGIGAELKRLSYPIMSVRVVTPGGREMVLASDAAAVVCLRRQFDNLLVERAQALGVTLETPFLAQELIREGGRIVGVRSRDGQERRARYVLCADGAHSIFGADPRPKRSISTLMGWWEDFDFVPEQLDMIFDKNLSPLYGWLFPETKNRVNIGICIDGQDASGEKTQKPLRATFDRFLQDHYGKQIKNARQIGKLKCHPIVFTTWIGHCTAPGAIHLGEAARITHNATGEGIYHALRSGTFAAAAVAAIVGGSSTEEKAQRDYVWEQRKHFTMGFLGGWALRGLVQTPVLDLVARVYNEPRVRKTVVKLLGSALAGSSVKDAVATTDSAAPHPTA
ncbi:geranylgeranyl reductase family protein [soil metagenome]